MVLVVAGIAGFTVCVYLAVCEYLESRRRRDKHFERKLRELEEGMASDASGDPLDSTLPDHFLRGTFVDAERIVMTRIVVRGYSVFTGRWEDWFREADRSFLKDGVDPSGVCKVTLWIRLAMSNENQERDVESIEDGVVREACRLPSIEDRVAALSRVFDGDEKPSPSTAAAVARILFCLNPNELPQNIIKAAIEWFPPIFMLKPDWQGVGDEEAVNIIITCPTNFIQSQNSIPLRFILAAIIVAVHDKSKFVGSVIDHQLSAYFKQKFTDPLKNDAQLRVMNSMVIPLVNERGWRSRLPVLASLFSVWGATLKGDAEHGKEDIEDTIEWFKSSV